MKPRIGISCALGDGAPESYVLRASYVEAVASSGGVPLLLPCVAETDPAEFAQAVDGLLLAGGGDLDPVYYGEEPRVENGRIDPIADAFELRLARIFLQESRPVFGICRGMQALNVAAGGDLHQDVRHDVRTSLQHFQKAPAWHGTHSVEVYGGSRLRTIVEKAHLRVNTFHHQAVRRIGSGFVVSAVAGDGVVEAIERPGAAFALGVQWHPERMFFRSEESRRLFAAFVRACATNQ